MHCRLIDINFPNLDEQKWHHVTFLYNDQSDHCAFSLNQVWTMMGGQMNTNISHHAVNIFHNRSSLEQLLHKVSKTSRVYVLCLPQVIVAELMKITTESDAFSAEEFVFFNVDLFSDPLVFNKSEFIFPKNNATTPTVFSITSTQSYLQHQKFNFSIFENIKGQHY